MSTSLTTPLARKLTSPLAIQEDSAGISENLAIAKDAQGRNPGTLTNYADLTVARTTSTIGNRYNTIALDSAGSNRGVLIGFTEAQLQAARGAGPGGTYSATVLDHSGAYESQVFDNSTKMYNGVISGMSGDAGFAAARDGTDVPANVPAGTRAYVFDGVNDQFVTSSNITDLNGGTKATYAAWIKSASPGVNDGIIQIHNSSTNRLSLNLGGTTTGGSDDVRFIVCNGVVSVSGYTTGNFISPNTWHHVVATYDGTGAANADRVKIYVDGVARTLSFGGTIPATLGTLSNPIRVGYAFFLVAYFDGRIADPRVYARTLSAAEAANLYAGTEPSGTSLIFRASGNDRRAGRNFGKIVGTTDYAGFHDTADIPTNVPAGTEAFVLDGVDDYVEFGDIPTSGTKVSIGLWVKASPVASKVLASQYDTNSQRAWTINSAGVSNNKFLVVTSTAGTAITQNYLSSVTVLDNTWHHIGFTFSSGVLKLYVDGVEDTAVTKTTDDPITAIHNSTAKGAIGCSFATGAAVDFFPGRIASFQAYTRVISAAEFLAWAGGTLPDDTSQKVYVSGNDSAASSGTSLALDGTNDYVLVQDADDLSFAGGVSITGWFKTSAAGPDSIVSKGAANNYEWEVSITGSKVRFEIFRTSASELSYIEVESTNTFADNAWHHFAGVYSNSPVLISVYVDSRLEGTSAIATGSRNTSGTAKVRIGWRDDETAGELFTGSVDDIRLFGGVLTTGQIANLASNGKTGSAVPTAISHWKFDEPAGPGYTSTVFDGSSSYNHGTITGSTDYAAFHDAVDVPANAPPGTEALVLDGVDDYVRLPDIADAGTSLSAGMWVKGAAQATKTIASHWDTNSQRAWEFLCDNGAGTNVIIFLSGDGLTGTKQYQTSITILDGTWHHIGFSFSASTLKVYVDGVEDTAVTKTTDSALVSIFDSTANAAIGCDFATGVGQRFFTGRVLSPQIYTRGLSAAEFSAWFNGTVPASTNRIAHLNGNDKINLTGKALTFDGVNDEVETANVNAFSGAAALTMSTWVKFTALEDFAGIIQQWADSNNRVSLRLGGAPTSGGNDDLHFNIVKAGTSVSGFSEGNVIATGAWLHVAAVYDGGGAANPDRVKVYLNARPLSLTFNGTFPATLPVLNTPIRLGKDDQAAARFLNGSMDDVRVYNAVLTAAQITYLASNGTYGTAPPAPVSHWKFDES